MKLLYIYYSYFYSDTNDVACVVIVVISVLGFIVLDVAYTTIVINYSGYAHA